MGSCYSGQWLLGQWTERAEDIVRWLQTNISETRMSLDSLNCRLNTGGLITKDMGLNVVDVRIIMMMLVS